MLGSRCFVFLSGALLLRPDGGGAAVIGRSQTPLEFDDEKRTVFHVSREDQIFRQVPLIAWKTLMYGPNWRADFDQSASTDLLLPGDEDLCFANRISSLREYIYPSSPSLWIHGVNLDALIYKYALVKGGEECFTSSEHPVPVSANLFMKKEYSQIRDKINYHVTRKWSNKYYPACACHYFNHTNHFAIRCDAEQAEGHREFDVALQSRTGPLRKSDTSSVEVLDHSATTIEQLPEYGPSDDAYPPRGLGTWTPNVVLLTPETSEKTDIKPFDESTTVKVNLQYGGLKEYDVDRPWESNTEERTTEGGVTEYGTSDDDTDEDSEQ